MKGGRTTVETRSGSNLLEGKKEGTTVVIANLKKEGNRPRRLGSFSTNVVGSYFPIRKAHQETR